MYRQRMRSPLRLLSATMSALMIVGLGAIAGPWFVLLAPVVAGLFLFAPPIGIYKHDETPPPRTGIRLEAVQIDGEAHTLQFRLVVANTGDHTASNFRIRLLVPEALVPARSASKVLGPLLAGSYGRNWFVDTTPDAVAITFRAGQPGDADAIVCSPASRIDLAVLNLPGQARPLDMVLEYQVSGGTAAPAIDRLRLTAGTGNRQSGIGTG